MQVKSIYLQYLCLAFMASNDDRNKITDETRKADNAAKATALRESAEWKEGFKAFLKDSGLKSEKNFDSTAGLDYAYEYISTQKPVERKPKFTKVTNNNGPLLDAAVIENAKINQLLPVARKILDQIQKIGEHQHNNTKDTDNPIPVERPFAFLFSENGISQATLESIYNASYDRMEVLYPQTTEA